MLNLVIIVKLLSFAHFSCGQSDIYDIYTDYDYKIPSDETDYYTDDFLPNR